MNDEEKGMAQFAYFVQNIGENRLTSIPYL